MGQHWTHWRVAFSPSTTLTEMRMNQTIFLVQPSEKPSRVIAKDDFVHTAARMEKNPAIYEKNSSDDRFSGLIKRPCLPSPRLTHSVWNTHEVARESCS
jgi:hypothetical protein